MNELTRGNEVRPVRDKSELTQINDVLEYLKEFGSITSIEAITLMGTTRLSAIIYVLRKRGYIIDTIIEKGKTGHNRPCKWARYVYKGKISKTP